MTSVTLETIPVSDGPAEEPQLTLNFGPQHPAAHGVLRMILDLAAPYPVILQNLEDGEGLSDALSQMDTEWTIRTLIEVMGIARTNAQRRIKEWENKGHIRKVSGGKKGRGGLAIYTAAALSS